MSRSAIDVGMSGFRWVAATAVAVLAGGLLVGCGGEPDVEPTPPVEPTTATPEPEPEPAEEAPEEPEAPLPRTGTPDEHDAEDAGEFFLELYEYTLATGDVSQWEERSHPDCGFCANVIEAVAENREAGARFEGVNITRGDASFVGFDDVLALFLVEVPYEAEAMAIVTADGSLVRGFNPGSAFLLMDLGYEPGTGWQLLTGGAHQESRL